MFEFIAELFSHHPELWGAVLGIIASGSLSQIIGSLWLPKTMTFIEQARIMAVWDFIAGTAITFILWHYFDPDKDMDGLRILGSAVSGTVAMLVHFIGLLYARYKWPWMFKENLEK